MNRITDLKTGQDYLYNECSNIKEEIVDDTKRECYIFFSSNGIYEDNSFQKFEEIMLKGDRYEWTSIASAVKKRKNVGKIIYVRDVYKNHYCHGINPSLCSIEKVIEYLGGCTKGYELTTVGISSGGYMAVIAGCELNAKRVFCISGQFDLNKHLAEEKLAAFRCKNSKYSQIVDLIKAHTEVLVYYFCPINCSHDFENYNLVKDISSVRCFLFPDKVHAATVYPFNYPDILTLSNKKLDKLYKSYYGKIINKNTFLLRTFSWKGIVEFMRRLCKSKLNVGRLKACWDVKK